MTIQELMDELDLIEDKTKEVYLVVEDALSANRVIDYVTHDINVLEHKNTIEIGGYID